MKIFVTEGAGFIGRVITKFASRIYEEKPLIIFGDGTNTRDFVAIEDVVESIHKTISKLNGKTGNVYNIASGKFITIKDVAKLMISISGKKLDIKFANPKKGDIKHSQASISLAKRELEIFPM